MKFRKYSHFKQKYGATPTKRAYRLGGLLICAWDCDSNWKTFCFKRHWSLLGIEGKPQVDLKSGEVIVPEACIKEGKLKKRDAR